jgi:hypothetical protein
MGFTHRKFDEACCSTFKHEEHHKHECGCEEHHHHDCYDPCAGVVTSGSLATFAVAGAPIPLPLTTPVLLTDCIEVAPTGGLIVREDGEYLVSFSASVLAVSATGSLSVYAGGRFLGNTGALTALGLTNFAAIVRLRRGDLVQVLANGPIAAAVLGAGTLTVAKLEE